MAIFKVPRITTIQRLTLLLEVGEIVYDTDQNIFYGGNGIENGGFPIGSGINSSTNVTEIITLTQENIDNKEVVLNSIPIIPESVQLTPNGGIPQINGIDFQVNLNILTWNSLGLDGFLEVGDILIVQYKNTSDVVIETIIVTQQNIDDKQITLATTPIAPEAVSMFIQGGLQQVNGIDFIIQTNLLKFDGLGLDGFLEVNDVLIVQH
jgi:hypothetical protein